jgi:hypothetical protein
MDYKSDKAQQYKVIRRTKNSPSVRSTPRSCTKRSSFRDKASRAEDSLLNFPSESIPKKVQYGPKHNGGIRVWRRS